MDRAVLCKSREGRCSGANVRSLTVRVEATLSVAISSFMPTANSSFHGVVVSRVKPLYTHRAHLSSCKHYCAYVNCSCQIKAHYCVIMRTLCVFVDLNLNGFK